jgi:single-stranded-DNA-specific exonuclease
MTHRLWRCEQHPLDGRERAPQRAGTHEVGGELARTLGVSRVVAGLLIARGCADPDAAHRFLHPSLDHLHDPFLLPDVDLAVSRLARAIEAGEKVLVHGDYDVDGVTAAALLTRVLRALGANVEPFVPHRRDDGYDLRVGTVQRAAQEGFRLIVTADCGIVAYEAAACARELGVDLIITDHHHPGETLPCALAAVNPHRADSIYPFKGLAGVGVAFKVATALVRRLGVTETSFRTKFLDLVALGTAADCMPLVDENRVFVKFGLEMLARTGKPGLRALMQVAGIHPADLSARSLGFALGPRINAVGRLDAARHALELLLTGDTGEALEKAQLLERCNRERQQEQSRILAEAMQQAALDDRKDDRILVLAAKHWHSGVIGIVASKVVESMGRPAIMIALEGDRGRGSARSVEGFHIYDAIQSCRELLEGCGGHAQAAGFDIRADRVEEFRQMLCRIAAESLTEEVLVPRLNVDAILEPWEVDLVLAHELRLLEPFGHGNPEPLFATRGMSLVAAQVMEARSGTQPHLSLRCRLDPARGVPDGRPPGAPKRLEPLSSAARQGTQIVEAIYWRNGEKAEELRGVGHVDICYHLQINEYRGLKELRLNVKDLRLSQEETQQGSG